MKPGIKIVLLGRGLAAANLDGRTFADPESIGPAEVQSPDSLGPKVDTVCP